MEGGIEWTPKDTNPKLRWSDVIQKQNMNET